MEAFANSLEGAGFFGGQAETLGAEMLDTLEMASPTPPPQWWQAPTAEGTPGGGGWLCQTEPWSGWDRTMV